MHNACWCCLYRYKPFPLYGMLRIPDSILHVYAPLQAASIMTNDRVPFRSVIVTNLQVRPIEQRSSGSL
jgi:hypothetical protein